MNKRIVFVCVLLVGASLGASSLRELLIDAIRKEKVEQVRNILLGDEGVSLTQRDTRYEEESNPLLSEDGRDIFRRALAMRNPVIFELLLIYVTRFMSVDLVQNFIAETTMPYIIGVHPGHVIPLYRRRVDVPPIPQEEFPEEEYGYRHGMIVLDLDWQESITYDTFKKLYLEKLGGMTVFAVGEENGHLYFFDGDAFERWRDHGMWTNPITRTEIVVGTENELGNVQKYQSPLHGGPTLWDMRALGFAISNYQNDIANLIMDYLIHFDVNAINEQGITPLYTAAWWGNEDMVGTLLGKGGIDVDKTTPTGETPLMVAAEKGYLRIVQKLLDKRAKLWTKDNTGKTVFDYAAQGGHVRVVERLLRYLNRYYQTQPRYQSTVLAVKERMLFDAAHLGYKEVVKELLSAGASVNVRDGRGATPLHYAAYNDHIHIVNQLIDDHADVNVHDKDGYTPLMITSYGGNTDIVEALLVAGANVNCTDARKRTALWYAASRQHAEVVNRLLAIVGIDVNISDNMGRTLLILAAHMGNSEIVDELLAMHNIQVNQLDQHGHTALMDAAYHGHIDVVRALLDRGAQTELQSQSGRTALQYAEDRGNNAVARLIREHGATVEEGRREGNNVSRTTQ